MAPPDIKNNKGIAGPFTGTVLDIALPGYRAPDIKNLNYPSGEISLTYSPGSLPECILHKFLSGPVVKFIPKFVSKYKTGGITCVNFFKAFTVNTF